MTTRFESLQRAGDTEPNCPPQATRHSARHFRNLSLFSQLHRLPATTSLLPIPLQTVTFTISSLAKAISKPTTTRKPFASLFSSSRMPLARLHLQRRTRTTILRPFGVCQWTKAPFERIRPRRRLARSMQDLWLEECFVGNMSAARMGSGSLARQAGGMPWKASASIFLEAYQRLDR